ncbi:hypothetical protein C5167_025256 [Papaver somniferum]|uniref:Uncharacterized protein n=1 Tax=Papaver somniferum TaxID=3469 RepID=A0A4Y7JTY1_PAPSO|nr:hypothetical protein C5167_025256 [Papaver somniferum]
MMVLIIPLISEADVKVVKLGYTLKIHHSNSSTSQVPLQKNKKTCDLIGIVWVGFIVRFLEGSSMRYHVLQSMQ